MGKPKDELKKARKALDVNSRRERKAGIKHETAAFRRLNRAVIVAEKNVSWWRR